ncbi:hypothetical protein [Kordiimonas gwangyangensis]|uniref:hypothetical protein n=1 Tax=Kordiimonas gwangyangensis TaxID=288022 RepID=UPI00046EE18A|nr:hypothetical protein [Kordiimonas gwangyangensis]
MNKWLAVALTLSLAAPSLPAAGEDEASFEASQAARAKGGEAFRAGELAAALKAMEEALAFRPTHPGLLGNVAYLAASTGDGQRAAEALRAYAALGLVPGDEIQAKVKEAVAYDAWQTLQDAFARNTRTIGTADIDTPLPADLRLVEGIAMAEDGTLYVGTVVSGGIYRMNGHKATMVLMPETMSSVASLAWPCMTAAFTRPSRGSSRHPALYRAKARQALPKSTRKRAM